MTPPPGEDGGLLNAFAGSLAMIFLAVLIGTPIGVLAGTYLAEFARRTRIGWLVRFVNDILLSAPSIVIGLFIYALAVQPVGHFSGYAGGLALAVILLPVVVRTSDEALQLVPDTLREAGLALGLPRWKITTTVIYRAASTGILTGALLGIARISGETAPLLFTALNNQYWSSDLGTPMANMPVVIFQFAMSPYDSWHALAWAGALVVTLFVLALGIVARSGIPAEHLQCDDVGDTLEPQAPNAVVGIDGEQAQDRGPGARLLLRQDPRPEGRHRWRCREGGHRADRPVGLRQVHLAAHPQPHLRALRRASGPQARSCSTARTSCARRYSLSKLRTQVGMVFQKPTPFPMSIYENIAFAVRHYERLSKSRDGRARRGGAAAARRSGTR